MVLCVPTRRHTKETLNGQTTALFFALTTSECLGGLAVTDCCLFAITDRSIILKSDSIKWLTDSWLGKLANWASRTSPTLWSMLISWVTERPCASLLDRRNNSMAHCRDPVMKLAWPATTKSPTICLFTAARPQDTMLQHNPSGLCPNRTSLPAYSATQRCFSTQWKTNSLQKAKQHCNLKIFLKKLHLLQFIYFLSCIQVTPNTDPVIAGL